MKNVIFLLSLMLVPVIAIGDPSVSGKPNDPMGLSNYVVFEFTKPDRTAWAERRLTRHEVWMLRQSGAIRPDGRIDEDSHNIHFEPKSEKLPKIKHKSLPTSEQIAKQTDTKHAKHPNSKGIIHVRPTEFPSNPTRDEIVHMQQDIQHIERTVGKALDLSLSAYAVAELPQATDGKSSLNVGTATANGKVGGAIGFSSNFGDKHEYTIKVSVSHAGKENAAGAGFGYQW